MGIVMIVDVNVRDHLSWENDHKMAFVVVIKIY